jgi:hypothetical protein
MRTQYKRLSRFIRTTDLQFVNARLSLIMKSLDLAKEMMSLDFTYNQKHLVSSDKLQTCALFHIDISLAKEKKGLMFFPQSSEIRTVIS